MIVDVPLSRLGDSIQVGAVTSQLAVILSVAISLGEEGLCFIGGLDLAGEAWTPALVMAILIAVRAANGSGV